MIATPQVSNNVHDAGQTAEKVKVAAERSEKIDHDESNQDEQNQENSQMNDSSLTSTKKSAKQKPLTEEEIYELVKQEKKQKAALLMEKK